jgi:xylulokinase
MASHTNSWTSSPSSCCSEFGSAARVSHVIGIDVSTTATKAVVVGQDGAVVGVAASSYEYQTPHPLWSEQDPHLWWSGAVDAVREAMGTGGIGPEEVDAIGLAGQMHGLVLLDSRGEVLRPAILWNDQRTGAECDRIREALGKERLIAITGNDALPGFTAPKLVWVRDHAPETWSRIAHVLLPKDYVRFRLTNGFAVDRADGAGTLLFDLQARDWSPEVLAALGVDRAWMPRTYEGPEVTGVLSEQAAEATGLSPGIPVVAGGGDQAAAAVGVGAVDPGVLSLSLGTSGVVFATTEGPLIDPLGRLHSFCHAVPGRWHVMGVMLSAGGSLRWFRDALAPGTDFAELVEEAATAPPGSDGLLFLPYLTGERTPYADPLARGAFIGLTINHERRHLIRAVLEGVAFGLRDCLELMRSIGVTVADQIRATGGGSASSVWRQILADVMEIPIATTSTSEGAAYGAALLAAVGSGWFPTAQDACRSAVEVADTIAPSGDSSVYGTQYDRYRALYPALAATFHSPLASSSQSVHGPNAASAGT